MTNHDIVDLSQQIADYTDAGDSAQEKLLRNIIGWTGINALPNYLPDVTTGDYIRCTTNADKSITLTGHRPTTGAFRGTVCDSAEHPEFKLIPGKRYVMSQGTPDNKIFLRIDTFDSEGTIVGWTTTSSTTSDKVYLTIAANAVRFTVKVWTSGDAENPEIDPITLYPMIYPIEYEKLNPPYEPYHDSVEVEIEEELYGVNLCDVSNAINASNIISAVSNSGILTFKDVTTAAWSSTYIAKFDVKKGETYYLISTSNVVYGRTGVGTSATEIPSASNAPDITWYDSGVGGGDVLKRGRSKVKFTSNVNQTVYLWFCNDSYTDTHAVFSTGFMCYKEEFDTPAQPAYHQYNDTAIQNQLNAQRMLGAKNLWDGSISMSSNVNGTFTKTADGYDIQCTSANNSGGFFGRGQLQSKYTQYGSIKVAFEYKSDIACAGRIGISPKRVEGVMPTTWTKYCEEFDASTIDHFVFYNIDTAQTPVISVRNIMIYLASDPDDTYVSYVMTNKELTDKALTDSLGYLGFGYGETTTAAATAIKVVTMADPTWKLRVGGIIVVGFSTKNSSSTMSLNVNDTGAIEVHHMGSYKSGMGSNYMTAANANVAFLYDGTYWRILGTTYSSSYS